jgi:hypothetical protein
MAVIATVLIPAKVAGTSIDTQYTASNVTTIVDKFTATNFDTSATQITVYLVTAGDTPGDNNAVVTSRTLSPNETYIFPEIVGSVILPGGYLATRCEAYPAVTIRASGREISA